MATLASALLAYPTAGLRDPAQPLIQRPATTTPLRKTAPNRQAAFADLYSTPIPLSHPIDPKLVPIEEGQPRAWIMCLAQSNWVLDLGEIPSDRAHERDVILLNRGRGTLVFESKSGGNPLPAVIADSELDPGESTTLRLSIDPRVREWPKGPYRRTVRMYSNDPLVPIIEFTVQAEIVEPPLP